MAQVFEIMHFVAIILGMAYVMAVLISAAFCITYFACGYDRPSHPRFWKVELITLIVVCQFNSWSDLPVIKNSDFLWVAANETAIVALTDRVAEWLARKIGRT